MIYNERLTNIGDRGSVLNYIRELKDKTPNFTLVDVGAYANPWTREYVTHIVDFQLADLEVKYFTGNISDIYVWEEVMEYVRVHGKFDFLTSTHTLEDISAAHLVCTMFGRIAKEGYIAVPSKYIELSRGVGDVGGFWLGYNHHRWIYDIKDGKFIGYPKQGFLENIKYVEDWRRVNPPTGREELQFYWKDTLDLKIINDDNLGPTCWETLEHYMSLIK